MRHKSPSELGLAHVQSWEVKVTGWAPKGGEEIGHEIGNEGVQMARNVSRSEPTHRSGPSFCHASSVRCVAEPTTQPGTKRRRDQDHRSVISFFFFRIQAYTVIYAHYIHNYILISAYKSYVKIIFFPQIYKFCL